MLHAARCSAVMLQCCMHYILCCMLLQCTPDRDIARHIIGVKHNLCVFVQPRLHLDVPDSAVRNPLLRPVTHRHRSNISAQNRRIESCGLPVPAATLSRASAFAQPRTQTQRMNAAGGLWLLAGARRCKGTRGHQGYPCVPWHETTSPRCSSGVTFACRRPASLRHRAAASLPAWGDTASQCVGLSRRGMPPCVTPHFRRQPQAVGRREDWATGLRHGTGPRRCGHGRELHVARSTSYDCHSYVCYRVQLDAARPQIAAAS
jgi:hypothetical protein